jgi:hypothetical protein
VPHIDIKYQPSLLHEENIVGAIDSVIETVARHFEENPAFVSLEVSRQTHLVRNRKAVDIEVDSSPDSEGIRARAVPALADDLAKVMGAHLESQNLGSIEVSAWVRVFAAGEYRYHRTAGHGD